MAFRILQPCHRTWTSLEGEGSARHCGECGRDVYELVDHTDLQIKDLVAAGKRVCVMDARPARRSLFAAAAVAITASHLSGKLLPGLSSCKVLVVDPTGAVVVGAEVRILNARKEILLEQKTDESGTANITFDWQEGMTIEIYSSGFSKAQLSLKSIPEAALRVVLELGTVGEIVAVPAARKARLPGQRLNKWERFKGLFRVPKS